MPSTASCQSLLGISSRLHKKTTSLPESPNSERNRRRKRLANGASLSKLTSRSPVRSLRISSSSCAASLRRAAVLSWSSVCWRAYSCPNPAQAALHFTQVRLAISRYGAISKARQRRSNLLPIRRKQFAQAPGAGAFFGDSVFEFAASAFAAAPVRHPAPPVSRAVRVPWPPSDRFAAQFWRPAGRSRRTSGAEPTRSRKILLRLSVRRVSSSFKRTFFSSPA